LKILPNHNKFNPGHDVTKIKENKEKGLGEDEDRERKGATSWKKMKRERKRGRCGREKESQLGVWVNGVNSFVRELNESTSVVF
jgi:hypothetical protein